MTITTKEIIKLLPFEDKFRLELLEKFDSLNPDQKFNMEQILWDAYFALYKLKLDENLQLAFLRAKENQEKLDKDFYKRVEEQTEKELSENTIEVTEEVDLEAARKAMEKIIKEIRATKQAK
ncbi:MAG: hypothetical protein HYT83_01560 [Candidatus Levybacteria bacterium]|nr:hypothetical protein [Candidatus Levybacteria bacterium]